MHYARLVNGFPNCKLINQNAFIVPDYFFPIDGAEKKYDAIYNARPRKFKRHYLARNVGEAYRLALILGKHVASLDDVNESELPKHIYKNTDHLPHKRVNELLNQSRVGLILSAVEGACFASSEYLLAGIPVVSTMSKGGRDYWYDEYNSLVV